MTPSTPFKKGGSTRGATWRGTVLRCLLKAGFLNAPELAFPNGIPPHADPLVIGIEVHEAKEAYFRRQRGENVPPPESFLKRDEAKTAYSQSMAALPRWLRTAEVIGVEVSGEVWVNKHGRLVPPPPDAKERRALAEKRPVKPFNAGPYLHTMRADLVVRLPSGKVRVIDWKTAWRVGFRAREDKMAGFDGNLQFLGLDAWGRRQFGEDYDGSWVILAPKGKQRVKRVGVLEVTPTSTARRRFGRTIVFSERLYNGAVQSFGTRYDEWPATLSEQGPCVDRYGICPYFTACRGYRPRSG